MDKKIQKQADTNNSEQIEKEGITRSEAIKKMGKVTLAAGTMMTLLNTKKAIAQSYIGPQAAGATYDPS